MLLHGELEGELNRPAFPAAASVEAAAEKGPAPAAGSASLSGTAVAEVGEVSEPVTEDESQGDREFIHMITQQQPSAPPSCVAAAC